MSENLHKIKRGPGRPPKESAPFSLQFVRVLELRDLLDGAVDALPEGKTNGKELNFEEILIELRPHIRNFLNCGYRVADFLSLLKDSNLAEGLTEKQVKHLFLQAQLEG